LNLTNKKGLGVRIPVPQHNALAYRGSLHLPMVCAVAGSTSSSSGASQAVVESCRITSPAGRKSGLWQGKIEANLGHMEEQWDAYKVMLV
jgi:hypothetical protein